MSFTHQTAQQDVAAAEHLIRKLSVVNLSEMDRSLVLLCHCFRAKIVKDSGQDRLLDWNEPLSVSKPDYVHISKDKC